MGREGGRTGRTHLMVGATDLSMAETLTGAAMHNAVELSAMKSFDVAPADQQQEGCEQERQRERPKWEFDARRAPGAALRTSNLIQMMEKGRVSLERREIGAQARLRAWCCGRPRSCCTLAARRSVKESTAEIAATNPGWAGGPEAALPRAAGRSGAV